MSERQSRPVRPPVGRLRAGVFPRGCRCPPGGVRCGRSYLDCPVAVDPFDSHNGERADRPGGYASSRLPSRCGLRCRRTMQGKERPTAPPAPRQPSRVGRFAGHVGIVSHDTPRRGCSRMVPLGAMGTDGSPSHFASTTLTNPLNALWHTLSRRSAGSNPVGDATAGASRPRPTTRHLGYSSRHQTPVIRHPPRAPASPGRTGRRKARAVLRGTDSRIGADGRPTGADHYADCAARRARRVAR